MQVRSFTRQGLQLVPIEVEVTLAPGLPTVRFFGQADQQTKESYRKIKAAIQNQGFRFPRTQQVLVNLRPSHIKKSCQGLDLAIAICILKLMGQLPLSFINSETLIYGELNLNGEVFAPEDITDLPLSSETVLTGKTKKDLPMDSLQISSLSFLESATHISTSQDDNFNYKKVHRPPNSLFLFSPKQARLLSLIATGEHSCLIAGPAGTGKSTLAHSVAPLLAPPTRNSFLESQKVWRSSGKDLSWRPSVAPHHTATAKSIIGSSAGFFSYGDMSRAHGGVLILDELLEFSNDVMEALREPCDTGQLSVFSKGQALVAPAQFLLLATTNLCQCGQFVPDAPPSGNLKSNSHLSTPRCRCTNYRKQRYLERLSGPFLDRFQILNFVHSSCEERTFTTSDILEQVKTARTFALETRKQHHPSCKMTEDELSRYFSKFTLEHLLPTEGFSLRRRLATLKLSRTLADLEGCEEIHLKHLSEALEYSFFPFQRLAQA